MPKIEIVSYSELSTFRQCPLKHELAYKQRWTKEKAEDSALGKGTLWHKVMEAHSLVLQEHQQFPRERPSVAYEKAILAEAARATREFLEDPTGGQTETQELIEWMYDGHVAKYGLDPEWRTLGVEVAFQVPLPWPDGRPSHYHLKGKIDRLVRSTQDGEVWILDEKSGANKPSDFELQLDDQFGLYTWAVQKLGHKVMGSIHAFARTTRNQGDFPNPPAKKYPQSLDDRFQRYYLNRSDKELKALADDAFNTARNMYPPKSMKLPLYTSPNIRTCGFMCDFKEVHLMAREGLTLAHALKSEGFKQDWTRH